MTADHGGRDKPAPDNGNVCYPPTHGSADVQHIAALDLIAAIGVLDGPEGGVIAQRAASLAPELTDKAAGWACMRAPRWLRSKSPSKADRWWSWSGCWEAR